MRWWIGSIILLIIGCAVQESTKSEGTIVSLPDYPERYGEMIIPEDNQLTTDRVALGKLLFNESALSLDSTISCATCHNPGLAFTDGLPTSRGIDTHIVDRNAPSLINVGYHPSILLDGTLATLEQQVLVPFQEHKEFNLNFVLAAERLRRDTTYDRLAKKAYGREMSTYVITRAIASYERTLISYSSPFDEYEYSGNKKALNEQQIAGYELFKTKLACIECHTPPFFTNFSLENIALYTEYKDPGRKRLTGKDWDDGFFRTPTLRNLKYTAPYMHDGSMGDLEDVIQHYIIGGHDHPNKSRHIEAFDLTELEFDQLLAFLDALNDPTIIEKYK